MFSDEDVVILAKAIIEDPVSYMDSDYSPCYYCDYCDATLSSYVIQKMNLNMI